MIVHRGGLKHIQVATSSVVERHPVSGRAVRRVSEFAPTTMCGLPNGAGWEVPATDDLWCTFCHAASDFNGTVPDPEMDEHTEH